MFDRYIGIDYSGAATPESSLKGIRVYSCMVGEEPVEVHVPSSNSSKKYWSRSGVAQWLQEQTAGDERILAGIDHGFGFPMDYFLRHQLPADWDHFLDDFVEHWPTDSSNTYVDFIRFGDVGNSRARSGERRWRRACERIVGAKSVFHFDVQGSVAKSTHSGLPWIRRLRRSVGERIHFWPFDGWQISGLKHVIDEVYPAIWNKTYDIQDRSQDQHDAFVIAAALAEAAETRELSAWFDPDLPDELKALGQVEGWILGVTESLAFSKR